MKRQDSNDEWSSILNLSYSAISQAYILISRSVIPVPSPNIERSCLANEAEGKPVPDVHI